MEKIYRVHKLVGLQLFLSGTPTFSSGTPTFFQMGVLNSCFQNPSESSVFIKMYNFWYEDFVDIILGSSQNRTKFRGHF